MFKIDALFEAKYWIEHSRTENITFYTNLNFLNFSLQLHWSVKTPCNSSISPISPSSSISSISLISSIYFISSVSFLGFLLLERTSGVLPVIFIMIMATLQRMIESVP